MRGSGDTVTLTPDVHTELLPNASLSEKFSVADGWVMSLVSLV
jgi:hypothetical protein